MNQTGSVPVRPVTAGTVSIGGAGKPVLIAGPCVLETEDMALKIAESAARLAQKYDFAYIFKGSFDKANRTSIDSYRGPGIKNGLDILRKVKFELSVPVLTDVHETGQVEPAAEVADILQIPAFLCRQTDLVVAAASTGRAVNIKKGQFLSPEEMSAVVKKAESAGSKSILLTERGTFFGYGRLVVDMAGMSRMRSFGYPVIFDATHSAQRPGSLGDSTGGDRSSALTLARAASAAGCDGLFLEIYPDPDKAPSDKATSLDFNLADLVLKQTSVIFRAVDKLGHGN